MLSTLSVVLFLAAVSWVTDAGRSGQTDFETRCLSFEPEKLVENSKRMRLEYVTNGTTLEFPDNDPSCKRASQLVAANLCRVALYIETSKRSGITFELWLPETWTKTRYISTGNGGVDGCKFAFSFPIPHGQFRSTKPRQASSMRIWHIQLPMALRPWERIMATMALPACHS